MKNLIQFLTGVLFIFLFGQASLAADVIMKSLSYEPKSIEIHVGQSVVWKNSAYTDHSATSNSTPPKFDTGLISPHKESKPIRFERTGVYEYHCTMHGKTMSGTVVVK